MAVRYLRVNPALDGSKPESTLRPGREEAAEAGQFSSVYVVPQAAKGQAQRNIHKK